VSLFLLWFICLLIGAFSVCWRRTGMLFAKNYYCEIKQVNIAFVVSFVIEIVANLEFLCMCIALHKF
jgi:hypothetical protein